MKNKNRQGKEIAAPANLSQPTVTLRQNHKEFKNARIASDRFS